MKLHINKCQRVGKTHTQKNKTALDFITSKTPVNYNHRLRVRVSFPAPEAATFVA